MSLDRLLEWNASSAIAEGFHVTPEGDHIISETQNVDHNLKAPKDVSEMTPSKDLRHVAYIPEAVWNQAYREGWVHDKKKWKEWANDPHNKMFRTWPGRI